MTTHSHHTTVVDFTDGCPAVPDGATNWERQEANRFWREALDARQELIGRLVFDHENLVTLTGSAHGLTSGNDAALLSKAHQATARLYGILDGIHHRLAQRPKGVL